MISYLLYSSYFFLMCSLIGNSKEVNKKIWRNIFVILTFGFMILMMGLRRIDVGNDTIAYVNFFNKMSAGDIEYDSRLEYGFRLFTILISKLSHNENLYILICATIIMVPCYLFLQKCSNNLFFCIALFWALSCVNLISATRQGIAVALICIGYLFLRENKRKSSIIFILLVLLASTFHYFAIIVLAMLYLRKRTITIRSTSIIVLITIILIYTNAVSYVFSLFSGSYYVEYYSNVHSGWVAAVFNALLGLFAFFIEYISFSKVERKELFINKKEANALITTNDNFLKMENMFLRWTTLFYTMCCLLSINNSIIGRVAMYFEPFLIVYISKNINKTKYHKLLIPLLIGSRTSYTILSLLIRPEWNSFFPYHFFWQK